MPPEKLPIRSRKAATTTAAPARKRRRRDDEVLAAAVKVFYQHGYSEATVQDIADEVGILKGSIYHYIKTKDDLLFRVLEQVHNDVEKILEDVAAIPELDALGRLDQYVRRQVAYNLAHFEQISVYYHDFDRLREDRLAAIIDERRKHELLVTQLIEDAQAAGTADPSLDARLLRNCVFATVIWTYRWYRPNGRASRETIADVCSRFVLRGVIGELPT
jgi:TetR/AcrR family transcriptional regulator, cholesterol catabolism regulator